MQAIIIERLFFVFTRIYDDPDAMLSEASVFDHFLRSKIVRLEKDMALCTHGMLTTLDEPLVGQGRKHFNNALARPDWQDDRLWRL